MRTSFRYRDRLALPRLAQSFLFSSSIFFVPFIFSPALPLFLFIFFPCALIILSTPLSGGPSPPSCFSFFFVSHLEVVQGCGQRNFVDGMRIDWKHELGLTGERPGNSSGVSQGGFQVEK